MARPSLFGLFLKLVFYNVNKTRMIFNMVA